MNHRYLLAIFIGFYAAASLVSMATMNLAAGLVGIILLLLIGGEGVLEKWKKELQFEETRRYVKASLILCGVLLISLLGAAVFPVSYNQTIPEMNWFKDVGKFWYFFWPVLLAISFRLLSQAQRDWVLRCWWIAFGILSVIGIQQYFTGWPRAQVIPYDRERFHTVLFLGHHLSVASVWIFPFFLGLDSLRLKRPILNKKILIPILILGATTMFLTHSRLLWISVPIGFMIWLCWDLPPKWRRNAVVIALIGAIGMFFTPMVQKRLAHTEFGIGHRIALWEANLDFFSKRPLTGVGFRKNIELSKHYLTEKNPKNSKLFGVFGGHAHSNPLEVLGGAGILGFLAWFVWSFLIFQILWKAIKNQKANLAVGALCAWIVFHLNGLTQVNFWEGKVMHQMMFSVAWILFWANDGRKLKT